MNIWWSLPLTLIVFSAARKLAARYKFLLLSPLLVAVMVVIPFLMLTGTPCDSYFKGSEVLSDLLQPAVVVLTYPSYEQLHQIRTRQESIITICFIGSIVVIVTRASMALLMSVSPEIAVPTLPKSVTTPIAMAVGGGIDGIPVINAVRAIFAGILGVVFGHTLLNTTRIHAKTTRDLTMGTASHALGAVRCAELNYQEGVLSLLALVLCGVVTSLITPLLFLITLAVIG